MGIGFKKVEDLKFSAVVERYAYNSDGDIEYAGFASRGSQSNSQGWRISRYTYDVNKNVVLKEIAFGAWDSRADLDYS